MNVSSVSIPGAAGQAARVSQGQPYAGATGAGAPHRPPPPPDGGALIGAVADALQSIGVTATGAADGGSATASTASTDAPADPQANAAQALGSYLHELMGALHGQGDGGRGGQPPEGQAYGPPGGAGGAGGRLASDLHGLLSQLSSSSADAGGTDAGAQAQQAVHSDAPSLETAFGNLLQALGAESSDAGGKLANFLQTLADKLPAAGSSGNLINTSV